MLRRFLDRRSLSVIGSVQLRETITCLRRKYTISNQKKQEIESFENIELHFRQAKIFDQWWQAVCFAADRMDFARSLLALTNRDGTKRTLVWDNGHKNIRADKIVKMTVPIRDRRAGSSLELKVEVNINGSLESAGRRVALFTRLIHEHGVVNLSRSGIRSTCVAKEQLLSFSCNEVTILFKEETDGE